MISDERVISRSGRNQRLRSRPQERISPVGVSLGWKSGVIWITGFSSAGKSTVGRQLERRLRSLGVNTLFLDGDDLRSIFGQQWGYDRKDRVDLAHVYFRLCSHLASQGLTVIIAAVAMYTEVREWSHSNIPGFIEVYLRVPEGERRRRDRKAKRIYDKLGDLDRLYDIPAESDLVFDNHGGVTPTEIAHSVADYFIYEASHRVQDADHGRETHWSAFYRTSKGVLSPSAFARTVAEMLSPGCRLLEVGCGNGRDASFFAGQKHSIVALDTAEAAITLCHKVHAGLPIQFLSTGIANLSDAFDGTFDGVYTRFCLHAMTKAEEIEMLRASHKLLRDGGTLFVECRSINDPLLGKGEVISPTERICGHYRRFIVLDELVERATAAGFRVTKSEESTGLAVFGEEDPVVIRVFAEKA